MEAVSGKELISYIYIRFIEIFFDICTPKKWRSDYIGIIYSIYHIVYTSYYMFGMYFVLLGQKVIPNQVNNVAIKRFLSKLHSYYTLITKLWGWKLLLIKFNLHNKHR